MSLTKSKWLGQLYGSGEYTSVEAERLEWRAAGDLVPSVRRLFPASTSLANFNLDTSFHVNQSLPNSYPRHPAGV